MILIIEDNDTLAQIFCRALEGRGYPSRYVTTAERALDIMREHKPDLLIVDIKLPGMDGIQFVALARQRGYDGPAIAMSGADAAMLDAELGPAGFNMRMQKPMTLDELTEAVSRWVRSSSSS